MDDLVGFPPLFLVQHPHEGHKGGLKLEPKLLGWGDRETHLTVSHTWNTSGSRLAKELFFDLIPWTGLQFPSLKLTKTHLKIGRNPPKKGKDRLKRIIFKGRTVSFRAYIIP